MQQSPPSDGGFRLYVLLERAEHLASLGRTEAARSTFEQAVRHDPGQLARNAYGCFLRSIEDYRGAIEQFTGLLDAARENSDHELLAIASNNLAAVFRDLGEYELASRFQQRATASQPECDHVDLSNLANDALVSGRYDLAERLVRLSLHMEGEDGSFESEAADRGTLGLLAGLTGNAREGIGLLRSACVLHRRAEDHRGLGADYVNLAFLFGALGRSRAQVRCLRRAVRCYRLASANTSASRARRLLREARSEAKLAAGSGWN